jgi:hypothetical protein
VPAAQDLPGAALPTRTRAIGGDPCDLALHRARQAYITNVNAALDKFPELKDLGLVGLNQAVGSDKIPKDVATVVRNNGGGHWNHSFLWVLPPAGWDVVALATHAHGGCDCACTARLQHPPWCACAHVERPGGACTSEYAPASRSR